MAEQRISEGLLVTLKLTAASNMSAGDMVGVSGHTVYSLSSATVNNTATLGYNFAGILDEDISAGQSPITVWTKGVFKLPIASGVTDANLMPGYPVWCDGSGHVTTPGAEGDYAIGTLVAMSNQTWGGSGGAVVYAHVRIRPGLYESTIAATLAALSATAPLPGAFPQLATR